MFWKNSRISIRDAWHLFIYIYHLTTGEKKDGVGETHSHIIIYQQRMLIDSVALVLCWGEQQVGFDSFDSDVPFGADGWRRQ